MSEFRRYRLVSKLLDEFGLSSSPRKYVSMLADQTLHKQVLLPNSP